MEAASEQTAFWGMHVAWLIVSALVSLLLYLKPRPRIALLALVLMHGLAFLGYYGDLPRTYAVGVSSDRALGVGMAMAVANGGSPYNHVQVQFGNLEPFWTFTVATLSGFSIDRVPFVYDHMALLVLTLTAIGFYVAWSVANEGEETDIARWRGVFVAAAVLGLSSLAMTPEPPIHHFWQANFVFKPNHSLAFGLVGLLSRFSFKRLSWLQIGMIQGALIWAFILDWAYVLPALFIAALIGGERITQLKKAIFSTLTGIVLALPYILHLLRDYNPVGAGAMPEIWRDQMGERLSSFFLWSLDMGPLLVLFFAGLYFAAKAIKNEKVAFGFLLTAPLVAVSYWIGQRIGLAPEPDEGFYYVRLVAGAGGGYALWHLAVRSPAAARRRLAVVFGLIMACSYPAYFNPFEDDHYYGESRAPLAPPILSTAQWIRENTPADSVLISAEGIMLSGLTGRRFLMVRPGQTADRGEREEAERVILTSLDEAAVRQAAAKYGVTHVVLDERLRENYGEEVRRLGNRPWFEPGLANSFARVLTLKKKD